MSLIKENAEEMQRRETESLPEGKRLAAIAQVIQLSRGLSAPACRCCGALGSVVRVLGLRGAPFAKIVLCEACDIRRTTDGSWPAGAPCSRCTRPLKSGQITVARSGEWLCAGCAVRGEPAPKRIVIPDLRSQVVRTNWEAERAAEVAERLNAEKLRFLELELERLTKLELERRMKEANPFVVGTPDGRGLSAEDIRAVMRKAVFRGETEERSSPTPLPAGPAPRRMRLGEEEV